MFRCAVGHISDPREKMVKVAIETRSVTMSSGSVRTEIVKEIGVCPKHAEQLYKLEEERRAKTLLQGLR